MSAYSIGLLVEKMSSPDKDFRFMAINDLMKELAAGTNLEEDSVVKVIRALLKLLGDNIGEIQNMAIKAIGALAPSGRVKGQHLDYIVDQLTPHLFDKNETSRDIHSMSMKAIVAGLPPIASHPFTATIVKKLMVKICEKLQDPQTEDAARIEVIEILDDLLLRFGDCAPELHAAVHTVLSDQLNSPRLAIRKRTTSAFGKLAGVVNSNLYDSIVSGLLQQLGNAKGAVVCRTLVVALTAVAKSGGAKFSPHLSKVVPYLIQFLRSSEDDDLKEASLQGLDIFLYRCPNEVAAFQTDVQQVLAASLVHDPNYEYGDEDEDDEMDMDEDEDDYSDDEDISWKVRRSSAKAIEAMINSRRESLLTYVNTLGPLLISRFKEREESVRNEILNAYIALLSQISNVIPDVRRSIVKNSDDNEMMTDDIISCGTTQLSTIYWSNEQINLLKALLGQKDKLLKSVLRVLRKNSKSGSACIELLTTLVKTCPGVLDGYLEDLIPEVSKVLIEKGAPAPGKMIVLNFVSIAFLMHDPAVFDSLLNSLTDMIIIAIDDVFYKVSSQGLILTCKYVDVLANCPSRGPFVKRLFETVNKKFLSNDTDQDVRERSIIAVSHILSVFKYELKDQINGVLEKLVERVASDMTCLVATRSATEVAAAGVPFEEEMLRKILHRITEYLKKMSRTLRLASLAFIQALLNNVSVNQIPIEEMSQVLSVLPNLITEADLQITNQSLVCISTAFDMLPHAVEPHLDSLMSSVVKLIQSSLLQGTVLKCLTDLFASIVQSKISNKPTFVELLDTVTSPVYDLPNLSRQAHSTISACAAVIAEKTNDLSKSRSLAAKLAEQLRQPRASDSLRVFAMCTLGELGRRCPATFEESENDVHPEQLAVEAFNSESEELKGSAATALGALAVGNLQKYLPFILEHIRINPKKQYLLLHALKEVIAWESEGDSNEIFRSAIPDTWTMLMNNAGVQEEGTRSVVAECLGRLCAFDPENLLPKLREHTVSPDAVVRSVVVNAIKFMLNAEKKGTEIVLQKYIGDFLKLASDTDLNVRRVTLIVLNSSAHNRPSLIRELLTDLLPAIYTGTILNKDLIREVEMGPFKHQVDDGLDLRKCAFECMYTLLENFLEKIEIGQFLSVLEVGLKDPSHDIKLLNYLTIQKLCTIAPGQLLQRVDRICEPLKSQLSVRPRNNAVKQELEKLEEIKKATVRVIFALKSRLPDVERQQQFFDLYNTVKNNKDLEAITEAVIRESQRAVVYEVPME